MTNDVRVTKSLHDWNPDKNYVGQAMENAMYASAHADDTLVLVGPPRRPSNIDDLTPIGVLQGFNESQGRQVVPHAAIGSARTFFQCSKSSAQGSIAKIFMNGDNLLKALYKNLAWSGENYDLEGFDSVVPFSESNKNFVATLDSNLFLIPFGLCVVYADKARNTIGSIYIELCVIPNYSTGISAGASTIMENVSFLADRVVPMDISLTSSNDAGGAKRQAEMNAVLAKGSDSNDKFEDRLNAITANNK